MTLSAFRERLLRRARLAKADVHEAIIPRLHAYFELLSKWNESINLTALTLDPLTDEAIDRLFIEPLAAAKCFPARVGDWLDVGSGGGSPALPLRLVCDAASLMMIEAKIRKVAFLREAVRTLNMLNATVLNARIEEVEFNARSLADAVTVRGLKISEELVDTFARVLRPAGWLLLFQTSDRLTRLRGFQATDIHPLLPEQSFVGRYRRRFHVEQAR